MKIKNSIDMTFINGYLDAMSHDRGNTNLKYGVATRKIDCPAYRENLLNAQLNFLIPMIICMCHLVTFLLNVSSIIIEKETKFRVNKNKQTS